MKRMSQWLIPVFAVTVGLSALQAAQQPIEKYSATAVNLDAPNGSATSLVQIQITRWSTDAERDQITNAVNEKGQDKLLDVVMKLPPVGSIRTPHGVGYDLRYARKTKIGTTEQIVVVTSRPIDFWERREGPWSIDYPFTLIELRIAPNGKGEGRMSIATKVIVDSTNKFLQLEDARVGPVILQNVRLEK